MVTLTMPAVDVPGLVREVSEAHARAPLPDLAPGVEGGTAPCVQHFLAKLAAQLPRGATYLEVGSWLGKSIIGPARAAQEGVRVVAVDTFTDSGGGWIPGKAPLDSQRGKFYENLEGAGVRSRVEVLEGDFRYHLLKQKPLGVGAYFYDADHSEEATMNGLRLAVERGHLLPGAVVVVDDWFAGGGDVVQAGALRAVEASGGALRLIAEVGPHGASDYIAGEDVPVEAAEAWRRATGKAAVRVRDGNAGPWWLGLGILQYEGASAPKAHMPAFPAATRGDGVSDGEYARALTAMKEHPRLGTGDHYPSVLKCRRCGSVEVEADSSGRDGNDHRDCTPSPFRPDFRDPSGGSVMPNEDALAARARRAWQRHDAAGFRFGDNGPPPGPILYCDAEERIIEDWSLHRQEHPEHATYGMRVAWFPPGVVPEWAAGSGDGAALAAENMAMRGAIDAPPGGACACGHPDALQVHCHAFDRLTGEACGAVGSHYCHAQGRYA